MEKQCRDYLTGRMSNNDPLAKKLIDELSSRVVSFILFVHNGETGEVIVQDNNKDNNWITRTRTACKQSQLEAAAWEIQWSLTEILTDLQFLKSRRDRMMRRNYYEFIIIDRTNAPKFNLLDRVACVLVQLSGNLAAQDAIAMTIRQSIPLTEQEKYMQAILGDIRPSLIPSTTDRSLSYGDNRVRAWDIQQRYPHVLEIQKGAHTLDDRHRYVLRSILSSMEKASVITKAADWEQPQAMPIMLKATDGHDDLYFNYLPQAEFDENLRKCKGEKAVQRIFCNDTLGLGGDGLRCFAETFKAANPDAVFTKGRIDTHYCSWPFPHMSRIPVLAKLNFCTPDGYLYKWNTLRFDFPMSFQIWQYLLHTEINCTLPFVRATQTTFIICASSAAEAEHNMTAFSEVIVKMRLSISCPLAHQWTNDLDSLNIEKLWKSIPPAIRVARTKLSSFFEA